MSREGKIAWLSIGAVVCGVWALSFGAIMAWAMVVVSADTKPDATGWFLTALVLVVFVILPGFLAWRLFAASRRLSAQRRDDFVHKEAFR